MCKRAKAAAQISGLMLLVFSLSGLATAKTVHVQVAPNNDSLIFVDATTGSNVTRINVGDTVEWDWIGSNHTVTSGGCCTPDGLFDLGTLAISPPMGQNAGFVASHVFNQAGNFNYFCRVHGGTFNMVGVVEVVQPDFTLSVATMAGPIFPSQTANFIGSLAPVNGYNNQVALSCVSIGPALPSTCSLSPSLLVPSTAHGGFTLTAGDPATPPRDYQFRLQAAGTDPSHITHTSQILTLKVVDFDFSAVPTVTVAPVATSPVGTFNVSGFNGFTGTVTLSCGNLPANAACNFPQGNTVMLSANASSANVQFSITTSNALAGSYQPTMTASTPGAPDKTHAFALTVQPDYELTVSNPLVQVLPGGGGVFNGTLAPLGGYSGSVTVTCGPFDPTIPCTPPASAVTLFSPQGTNGQPVNFSVSFASSNSTVAGDYTANITGTDTNSLNHAMPVNVRVVDFKVTSSSPTVTLATGNPSAPIPLTVSAMGEWSPAITLSCGGPAITAGALCNFSPSATVNPGMNGSSTVALVISGATAPAGQSTVTVTATTAAPVTAHVTVGPPLYSFTDVNSGTTTTSIHVGDTVQWDWALTDHSSTSGICGGSSCAPSGGWDSGINEIQNFSYAVVFNTVGAYSYFCRVHGPSFNMRGLVNVAAGPSTATRTQDITLNIGAGAGTADLGVAVNHALPAGKADPAPVGTAVHFNATVTNATAASSVPATLTVMFLQPVEIEVANLPAGCSESALLTDTVNCALTSTNGSPTQLAIPVIVPFVRSVSAQAFVSSDAADPNPADNGPTTDTVQVRPRPFSRNGLLPIVP